MASESDTWSDVSSHPGPDVVSQPEKVIYKFGNAAISDVTFLVGGKQFQCHKMLLAAKCDYFTGMFASGFKEKDQALVDIDADPVAFKRIMDIIYNGRIDDAADLFMCNSHEKLGIPNGDLSKKLWKEVVALFALADRFLLTDIVRYSIEGSLLRYNQKCPHNKPRCYHCATKMILAARFSMDYYKTINVSTRSVIMKASNRLYESDLGLSSEALGFLLARD